MTESYIDFTVKDVLSDLANVTVTLNGEEFSITQTLSVATFRIYKYHLTVEENILHVYAVDARGNILDADFIIYKTTAPTTPSDTEDTPYATLITIIGLVSIVFVIRKKRN
ncbi:MAG: hypothetical protein ACTSQE_06235 [Candidatus Heimdallarchaeaceae archaeon]